MNHALEMKAVCHAYESGKPVLDQFSFSVDQGEIACLLGPSGCGKTTALRVAAGFENIESGAVVVAGKTVNGSGTFMPPEKRLIGVVFQDASLFPHLTVEKNIAFGLHGADRKSKKTRTEELLNLVNLTDCGGRYPHQLSGGQRQRVALARAMAPEPALILLDEPYANLDGDLRQSLSRQVRAILKQCHMTAILVTHDQEEAFATADRIAVMSQGRIQQIGTADDLYHRPENRFVAGFIGDGSFLQGEIDEKGQARTALGAYNPVKTLGRGTAITALVRPEELSIDSDGAVRGILRDRVFRGNRYLCSFELANGDILKAHLVNQSQPQLGDEMGIRFNSDRIRAFPV